MARQKVIFSFTSSIDDYRVIWLCEECHKDTTPGSRHRFLRTFWMRRSYWDVCITRELIRKVWVCQTTESNVVSYCYSLVLVNQESSQRNVQVFIAISSKKMRTVMVSVIKYYRWNERIGLNICSRLYFHLPPK